MIKQSRKRRLTVIAVIVIAVAAIAVALLVSAIGGRHKNEDFLVYYDDKIIVPYENTVRNGKIYINAFELSEYCNLTITGSTEKMKISSGDDQYIVFTVNSDEVKNAVSCARMDSPAYYDHDALWIPCDFVNSAFRGVSIIVDTEKNKLSVWREETPKSTEQKRDFVKVTFDISSSQTSPANPEKDVEAMISAYVFTTDVSKYMRYFDPDDERYLMLVNKTTKLGDKFVPVSLVSIDKDLTIYGGSKQLDENAAMALSALMQEMRAAGFKNIYVTSAYRNYAYQSALFSTYIDQEMKADRSLTYEQARDKVLTYSAEPGTSEHQSGLCLDFIASDMTELDESFASQPVYPWLIENAYKFGFILRYPEDKVKITGYSYEPWHYRFVGQHAAAEMHITGDCFEEYIAKHK